MVNKLWLSTSLGCYAICFALIGASFLLPSYVPASANGTITSTGNCWEMCQDECEYLGNVTVEFVWENLFFEGSVEADTFCGLDCCQSLVQKRQPVYVWIQVNAENEPTPYYISLSSPSVPSKAWNFLIVGSIIPCILGTISLGGIVESASRPKAYYAIND